MKNKRRLPCSTFRLFQPAFSTGRHSWSSIDICRRKKWAGKGHTRWTKKIFSGFSFFGHYLARRPFQSWITGLQAQGTPYTSWNRITLTTVLRCTLSSRLRAPLSVLERGRKSQLETICLPSTAIKRSEADRSQLTLVDHHQSLSPPFHSPSIKHKYHYKDLPFHSQGKCRGE